MYNIKVDTELLNSFSGEYKKLVELLCYTSEEIKSSANMINELNGFNIEELTEQLYLEANLIEGIGEKIIDFVHTTERVSEIYRRAEDNIRRNVNNLPVLIHNNISKKGAVNDVMGNCPEIDIKFNVTECTLLCDNTVVHEDWLIDLIAKNKFGG